MSHRELSDLRNRVRRLESLSARAEKAEAERDRLDENGRNVSIELGRADAKAAAMERQWRAAEAELARVTAERDRLSAEAVERTRWVLLNAVDAHKLKVAEARLARVREACDEIEATWWDHEDANDAISEALAMLGAALDGEGADK